MPEETKKASLREFCAVVWQDWGSRVSGGFSIPFTLFALFAKADYAKVIWAALAAIGIIATAYQVWAKERKKVVELENALLVERDTNQPKLDGSIDQIFAGPVTEGTIGHINVCVLNKGASTIAHK